MAGKMKASKRSTTHSGREVYPYPSPYGSHDSMIDQDLTGKITQKGYVICRDLRGPYVTEQWRLDEGLSDPWRCSSDEWRKDRLAHFVPESI